MDKAGRPFSAYPGRYKRSEGKNEWANKEKTPEKHSYYTKEDLHQHVFTLKSKLNDVLHENKLLKAKIVKLEKKTMGGFFSPLKSKSTANFANGSEKQRVLMKLADVEIENKLIKEDRNKLKNLVDVLTNNPPPEYKKIYEKYAKQCVKIRKLKAELGKDPQKIEKKPPLPTKSEEFNLSKNIIESIYEYSCKKKLDFDEIWCVINPNDLKSVNFLEFSRGVQGLGLDFPLDHLKPFFSAISQDQKLTQSNLESALKHYKSSCISYTDLKIPIQHFFMRLQIHRMSLEIFVSSLPEQHISSEDLFKYISNAPFHMEKHYAEAICKYVFMRNLKCSRSEIQEKFRNIMGSWKIFTEDEEIELDDRIRAKFEYSWEIFLKKCSEGDRGKMENISFYQFAKICKSLDFEFNADIEQYLRVLFYTDKLELDVVPYLSFIIAYAPGKQ